MAPSARTDASGLRFCSRHAVHNADGGAAALCVAGATWRHPPSLCVAGAALGDIHLRCGEPCLCKGCGWRSAGARVSARGGADLVRFGQHMLICIDRLVLVRTSSHMRHDWTKCYARIGTSEPCLRRCLSWLFLRYLFR